MKRIKHSKIKNTGLLFELLTRQITYEILDGREEKSKEIVREFFNSRTELSKELRLFNLLLNEKQANISKSEKFLNVVLEAHTKINYDKLEKEKYNLIKTIKESFEIENFLSSPISNYKVLASIHKVFRGKTLNVNNVKDIFESRETLIEHISKTQVEKSVKKDEIIESYKKQEQDVRLLTYKILVETFNKKYSNLDESQKSLLKNYINNVNNSSKFKEYYKEQLKKVVKEIHSLYSSMEDQVTKIKLKETINVLKGQRIKREVSDSQVSSLMMAYELVKEIKLHDKKLEIIGNIINSEEKVQNQGMTSVTLICKKRDYSN